MKHFIYFFIYLIFFFFAIVLQGTMQEVKTVYSVSEERTETVFTYYNKQLLD